MTTLAIHGHFYQPDRRDPTTDLVPIEESAAPAPNWNERITTECYRPNALAGNFTSIGWDAGATLLLYLRKYHPDVHAALAMAATTTLPPRQRSGRRPVGPSGRGAMASGFHHSILPLSIPRDRRTEIIWGTEDFALRFGRAPEGFWLPECAVDMATLADLSDAGIEYVILAPWQAAESVDTRRPYRVELGSGRSMIVMFYDGGMSADISFRDDASMNADRFISDYVAPRSASLPDGSEPILLVATDGELYGHHKAYRDWFLRALPAAAERAGVRMRTLGDIVSELDAASLPEVHIAERTSWSCHHGILRWGETAFDASGARVPGNSCYCTGDSGWKPILRAAFDRLADRLDLATENFFTARGLDFWGIRDRYAPVAAGFSDPNSFAWAAVAGSPVADDAKAIADVRDLLTAARSRLAMFTSCAWFWDDPSRLEMVNCLRHAAYAVSVIRRVTGVDAEPELLIDLAGVFSPRTAESGPDLYRRAADTSARTRTVTA